MKRRSALLLLLPAGALLLFFLLDLEPGFTPRDTGIEVSERARRLHQRALVFDLHVDSLLWPRDLGKAGEGGHLDLHRMRAGGLDAVAFTLPTRFFGLAGLKAFHDLWPPRTWFSPWERLRTMMAKPMPAGLELAVSPQAIRRNHAEGKTSYFYGVEGAHALEGDPARIQELRRAGVAFVGLVHLSDNEIGGSSSGTDRGLSAAGRALVEEMNRAGVLVDLSHASPRTFFDALQETELPPVVSHAGVRAIHDSWRNLSDDQIRAVAERQGVIGVMLAPPALRERSLEEAVRHIEHVLEVGGEHAAALGSDFDGYVHPPIDASGLAQLTELMLQRGWTEERIMNVLGENALRLLRSLASPTGSRRSYIPPRRSS